LSDKEKPAEGNPPDPEELLAAAIPYFFERLILSASSDEERARLAVEFGMNPQGSYKSILGVFQWIKSIRSFEPQRAADADLIERYAEIAYQAFTRHRTRTRRRGFAIEVLLEDGTTISSFGHSLNEGMTQWLTNKNFPEWVSKVLPELAGEIDPSSVKSEAYALETAFVSKLIIIFGEEAFTNAYFGDDESFDRLVQSIDQRFGKGAFQKIVELSDKGRWRDAFRFVESSEAAAATAQEESDGAN
jgi:hypothetical protein